MLKLLADENFDNTILRGLLRRQSDIDIIRVQDTELYGANDPTVLAWAAQENRILLTHDVATITRYAYERIAKEQSMPLIQFGTDLLIINDGYNPLFSSILSTGFCQLFF
jgi:Domain of unknown function (DUF5615)